MWQGIGCLTMGYGGHCSVCCVQRVEVGGCMDNDHAQERRDNHQGGTLYSTLVCSAGLGTLEWTSVLLLNVECSNIQTLNHATQRKIFWEHLQHVVMSLHAYKLYP